MPNKDNDAVQSTNRDPDGDKGAVAQDRPGQPENMASFNEQIDHRDQQSVKKGNDTDFPEPGSSPEYSMQKQDDPKKQGDPTLRPKDDPDGNAGAELNDQDPGERQKQNQNDKKDDDLAA
jgi:hypothetical protein